jgi:glutathione synthase/RimK-type ligase-like ATP-grasp enzyme
MLRAMSLQILRTVMVAVTLFAVAPLANAQTREKEAVGFVLTAQIESIDAAAKTLTLKGANGEGGVYVVNDKTTIMNANKKIAFSDLKKGWRLAVNGDKSSGKNVATYMEVVETDTK